MREMEKIKLRLNKQELEFLNYINDFYARGGIYADFFGKGAKKSDIKEAFKYVVRYFINNPYQNRAVAVDGTWPREMTRDVLLYFRGEPTEYDVEKIINMEYKEPAKEVTRYFIFKKETSKEEWYKKGLELGFSFSGNGWSQEIINGIEKSLYLTLEIDKNIWYKDYTIKYEIF